MSDRASGWSGATAVYVEMLNSQQRTIERAWSSWLAYCRVPRAPSFGPIEAPLIEPLIDLSESWLASLDALRRYQGLGLTVPARIGSRFASDLASGEHDAPESLRALFERWISSGDQVLLEIYRTDDYLAAQRALIENLMRCRSHWQRLQNELSRESGLPSREELDDAHRSIAELRRELRRLKREMVTS